MNKKDRIRSLLSEALPLVDLDAVPLFNELDSLGVTMILMILSKEYGIDLESQDATPEKLWSLDSIVALVDSKLAGKK